MCHFGENVRIQRNGCVLPPLFLIIIFFHCKLCQRYWHSNNAAHPCLLSVTGEPQSRTVTSSNVKYSKCYDLATFTDADHVVTFLRYSLVYCVQESRSGTEGYDSAFCFYHYYRIQTSKSKTHLQVHYEIQYGDKIK